MSEEQVTTAIAVLRAYADGTLQTDQCDELDAALDEAYRAWARELSPAWEFEEPSESLSDMTGSMEWLEAREQD